MLLQVNFGAELRCRIVGVGALALGFWFSLWLVLIVLTCFDRFVLASMPFFDASPWHYESLFGTAQKLTKNAVRN